VAYVIGRRDAGLTCAPSPASVGFLDEEFRPADGQPVETFEPHGD
jgi:hypothetical protein